MKPSKQSSEPLQVYRAWNKYGIKGYVFASSLLEAKKIFLLQYGFSEKLAFMFNVELVNGLMLTEIE